MSFKERNCDMMEHHSGIPEFPVENGKSGTENGIILTNVVGKLLYATVFFHTPALLHKHTL